MTDLPWPEVELDEICSLITDGTHHSPSNHSSGAYRYVTAKNIRPWGLDLTNITWVDEATHAEIYARCPVEKDDVLYIKDGVTTGIAVLNNLAEPFSLLSSVALLKPDARVLYPPFLKHWLNSPLVYSQMTAAMTGSAIRRLVLRQIRTSRLQLPPLNEQKRIADKLDAVLARVDAYRERLGRVPAILKRFRQSVLAAATSGKLTVDWRSTAQARTTSRVLLERLRSKAGRQKPNEIVPRFADSLPEGWTWAQVKDVGDVQLGRQRSPRYHSGANMRPYLRVMNVKEGFIDTDDVMEMVFDKADFERYQLRSGDILLNEGQSLELIGRPAVYRGEVPGACFTNTLVRFRAYDGLVSDFAFIVFLDQMKSGRLQDIAKRTVNIAHLGSGRFSDLEFPLPSAEEQREIVRRVEALFAYAHRLEARYAAARAQIERLTPALLAKAFRGELAPQDPSDEPASVLLERVRDTRTAAASHRGDQPRTAVRRTRAFAGPGAR